VLADLVLPAASWGEAPFSRMQGERRLRSYGQFVDPPGETRPDWAIVAEVARRLERTDLSQSGYDFSGFDWSDANALFEEAGLASRGAHDYRALVELARERGQRAFDVLAGYGTHGVQCPLRRNGDTLEETIRLHSEGFGTVSRRAIFVRPDWSRVAERQLLLEPKEGELWLINRRHSSSWNSLVEDARNPFRREQLEKNYVEINPRDAENAGIRDDEAIVVESDIGSFSAFARLTEATPPGVACAYFNFGGSPDHAANNVVSREQDGVSTLYSFKLGRARIRPA
jgi:assimilatory nitrate reductase catalytic subunit